MTVPKPKPTTKITPPSSPIMARWRILKYTALAIAVCAAVMLLVVVASRQMHKKPKKDHWFLVSNKSVDEELPRIPRSRVRILQIERADLKDEDLAIVSTFKNLERLYIHNCKIDDDGLRHLSKLKKLRRLSVISTGPTDTGLAHVAELKNLEDLSLRNWRITGRGLAPLVKLQSLQHLGLESCPLDDEGMQYIARLSGLRSLWLSRTNVTDAGLLQVSHLYGLMNVTPSDHMTIDGMRKFRETLLAGRIQARNMGIEVPPHDALLIQTYKDKDVRGALPPPEMRERSRTEE